MKEIELFFYGYTWEEYAFLISSLKGVFVIYRGCLDPEGFVRIKEVLYIGYHKCIFELYDYNVVESVKQFLTPSDRLFLSYAEVFSDVIGFNAASLLVKNVHPRYCIKELSCTTGYKLICKGSCKLIPEVLLD